MNLKEVVSVNAAAAILFFTDRILKIFFVNNPGYSRDFIVGFLHVRFLKNSGVAFGLLDSANSYGKYFIFIVVLIFIFIVLFFLASAYKKNNKILILLFTFIAFGAVSNFFDRIRFGYVVDYIDVPFFTVFNIADMMISFSVIAIFVFEVFQSKKKEAT